MADKRIRTRYPVLDVIADRWSPRSYSSRVPSTETLGSLFEAARLAPSAHNTQPVRFILARKTVGTSYDRLFACLDDHNKVWAHAAPVLILAAVMRQRFSQEKGGFVPYPHAMHDLGLAVMSLILQSQSLGLYSHPMAAFDPQVAQREFSIPNLYEAGMVIALGYAGKADELAPSLREKELAARVRRPLEEIVFEENWGLSSTLFSEQRDE